MCREVKPDFFRTAAIDAKLRFPEQQVAVTAESKPNTRQRKWMSQHVIMLPISKRISLVPSPAHIKDQFSSDHVTAVAVLASPAAGMPREAN